MTDATNTMAHPHDPRSNAITLALTGASGARYGLRVLQVLLECGIETHLLVSQAARTVLRMEERIELPAQPAHIDAYLRTRFDCLEARLHVHGPEDWSAPVASGSARIGAMAICPCSTGTLGRIAAGVSGSLTERAADVMLKERRKLILMVRETPLSAIHLNNMLRLAEAGATIMPASPGFYNQPQTLDDLVDFMAARVLDHLGIEHRLLPPWGEAAAPEPA